MHSPLAELGGRLNSARIWLIIGTRPEAIKIKPVAIALGLRGIVPTLILTGQHETLDPVDFGLAAFPLLRLNCPGCADPHAHVKAVTAALASLLASTPDLIVVQGDTSSALGGALAGFITGIPVAHVEAGLRTHDPALPWPEEEYRTAIDARADLLFAPTDVSATNLRAESAPGAIHVTGNTSIDAVIAAEAGLLPPVLRESGRPRILVTCHRRESWRDGLQSIADALSTLARRGDVGIDLVLHPNRFVADQMRQALGATRAITLIDPCSHSDLLTRMRDCDLILSDSGGIQEEAPALGVPLLVLREKTERPEGVAAGSARLVGTDRETIVGEVRRLLDDPIARASMSQRKYPFGDGRAAGRIAAIIANWLENRPETHSAA